MTAVVCAGEHGFVDFDGSWGSHPCTSPAEVLVQWIARDPEPPHATYPEQGWFCSGCSADIVVGDPSARELRVGSPVALVPSSTNPSQED